jgi:uncharacterized membrane protein YeaQ/YmgE (transglycosylase-associated protein family)
MGTPILLLSFSSAAGALYFNPTEADSMIRNLVGVVVGALVWMFGFYILAIGLALLWPAYALQGRIYFRDGTFNFTTLMACSNVLMWALAAVAAGWVASRIATRREAAWVLAAVLGIYLATLHLFLYWPRFPWWYNLAVVIPTVPAVLLGARRPAKRTAPG